jgi:hypothetical protein
MKNITPPGTPAKRTLAVLDNPPPAPSGTEAAPSTRISGKVKTAIDAMVSGDCTYTRGQGVAGRRALVHTRKVDQSEKLWSTSGEPSP